MDKSMLMTNGKQIQLELKIELREMKYIRTRKNQTILDKGENQIKLRFGFKVY